jgi:hypothetical protein
MRQRTKEISVRTLEMHAHKSAKRMRGRDVQARTGEMLLLANLNQTALRSKKAGVGEVAEGGFVLQAHADGELRRRF